MRQKTVQKEDDDALREAAREASKRQARGEEPGEPVTLADIQKAAQKKDHLRYWSAPFRWGAVKGRPNSDRSQSRVEQGQFLR